MEIFITLLTIIVILLLTVLGRGLLSLYENYQKIKHIPGVIQYFQLFPFRIPFFSSYFALGQYEELEKAIEKYGDPETKTLSMATSSGPVVWISDPKLLKEYFITKGSYFEKPDYNVVSIFGENVVSAPTNDRWKKHFKTCSPAFSPRNLMYMCKVAVNSCDCLFELWNKKLESGPFVLDLDDYSNLTLDILSKAGFNIDFGIYSKTAVEGQVFRHNMEKMQSPLSIILMLIFSKDSLMYKALAKMTGITDSIQYCSKFLDDIIEERKTLLKNEKFSTDETSDILSLLVDANVKEDLITNDELKSNALILSIAGHETTAKTTTWISYHLSKRPDIQEKLWEEVDRVLQGRDPTYDDYQNLPYVHAILMESLRLCPPVLEMNKFATKNLTLGKYEIPKGTVVHPMFSYVQRREDIWENAKEFKPERFLEPSIKDNFLHNFTFSAFSLGNRQCLGKNFALLEATMMISKIAQKYELKLLNDESKDPVGAIQFPVNRPTPNLKIQISKRKSEPTVSQ